MNRKSRNKNKMSNKLRLKMALLTIKDLIPQEVSNEQAVNFLKSAFEAAVSGNAELPPLTNKYGELVPMSDIIDALRNDSLIDLSKKEDSKCQRS